jgi:hypothetical protein
MNWSDTTPAPTVAGTQRAYSDGDCGHDDAGSEVDLTLSNAGPRPRSTGTLLSAEGDVWRSKPPGVSAMSRSLKARASAQKKRNQTIDIGSYHCPLTLATKSARMDFARGR